jgi:hypothetical protein
MDDILMDESPTCSTIYFMANSTDMPIVTALPAFPNGHPACAGLAGFHGGVGLFTPSLCQENNQKAQQLH